MTKRLLIVIVFLCMARILEAEEVISPVAMIPEVIINAVSSNGVRSFSKFEIERSGATTAAEFLQQVSGMLIREDGASGGKQFVRIGGSNVNQVLVLVDGIRLADVGSGEADLSRVPVEWIESIEISTGGGGMYGSEAIGGVISIQTSAATTDRFTATVAGSSSSADFSGKQEWSKGSTRAAIGVTREQGSGDYRFRITEEDGNGPFTLHLGEVFRRENNRLLRDRVIGKIDHEVGNHSLTSSVWIERAEFGLPGYLAPRPTSEATQSERLHQIQFGWKFPSAIGMLKANAGALSQNRDFSDPDQYSFLHESHESSNRLTAASSLQRTLFGAQWLTSARVEREVLSSGVLENQRAIRNRWQVGFELSHGVQLSQSGLQKIELSAGVNGERFGDAELQLLPSGAISYSNNVTLPFAIGIRGSQAYLAPSFYSLFWNDELLAQGNPDLRPESSEMWQGFAKVHSRWRLQTTVEVGASLNDVHDLIYWRQAFDGRWTPQNLRSASINQLVASMKQSLIPSHCDLQVSYEWLESRDHSGERVTDGNYLIYRPLRMIHASLNGNARSVHAHVHLSFVDKQAVLETNSKWLPAYTLLNAELSREFSLRELAWEAGIKCSNILDSDYRVVRFAPMPLREISMFVSLQLRSGK